MIICVMGDLQDLTLVYVAWVARQMGFEVLELDESALGSGWESDFESDAPSAGVLRIGQREVPFSEIAGVYVHVCPDPELPTGLRLDQPRQICFKAERRFGLYVLLEALPSPVANRPSAGRANGSKPLQMAQLERAGFAVPEWIVSNDPGAVREFVARQAEGAIYKPSSGLRTRVRKVDRQLSRRLAAGTTPILVQQFIKGVDVRVHTVGDEAYATRISGTAGTDYRFESAGAQYEAITPPTDIQTRCAAVARAEGLLIAGFDFRVTPDDTWYCLEVNPVPTFLPYEMCTGQPIATALLNRFTGAHPGEGRFCRSDINVHLLV
jgi:glutathione synthase/RimK-type ligase-like ATP-grasp enzyme